MTLQFHAYPIEDGGAQIADTIGKGLQNLGNTYVDYQKAKSNAARQAMLDKFMREEQMRKMKEYAYDYETPLVSPNPTNAGPRIEPQPMLRQPGGSSLVDEWNRKMGGGSPRVPSFGGVQSNTDPYAGMSPEMARYAAIPGAKNRAEFSGAYKAFGDPMERQADIRLKNAQADYYERRPVNTPGDKRMFTEENQLRSQYFSQSKDFSDTASAYQRIIDSSREPSAAGDLALIFNYMKMLDPGSTVREGEFANAAASGSYGARFQAAAQKIATGQRLDDSMRADFMDRATELYRGQLSRHKQRQEQFRGIAESYGRDPSRVAVDIATPIGGYGGGRIKVSNGRETLEIDASDEAEAASEGFRRIP